MGGQMERRPWERWAALAGLLAVVGGAVTVGAMQLPTARLELTGPDDLTGPARAAVAPLVAGKSLATVELDPVLGAVLSDPWVATAKIMRRWPDQLEVALSEKRGAGLAHREGVLGWIDPDGVWIAPAEPRHPPEGVVLEGGEDPQGWRALLAAEAALQQVAPGLTRYVAHLHRDGRGRLSAVLRSGGVVRFGSGDPSASWQRLERVAADDPKVLQSPHLIDLGVPKAVLVRTLQGSTS